MPNPMVRGFAARVKPHRIPFGRVGPGKEPSGRPDAQLATADLRPFSCRAPRFEYPQANAVLFQLDDAARFCPRELTAPTIRFSRCCLLARGRWRPLFYPLLGGELARKMQRG